MCALILGNYIIAQNSDPSALNPQEKDNEPTPIEGPAAYSKITSTPISETTQGVESNTVEINLNHTGKAFYGTYGELQPDGTSGFGESLIYTNGPLTESNSDLSILQTNLGLGLFAPGVQKESDNSIADDFTLTNDFDITEMDFYLYQTGENTATISAAYVQIWDGDPSAGGSVIWGDLSSNRIGNVVLTDLKRVKDTDPTNEDRKIQRVTINTSGLSLTAGTYYLQTTFEGTGSSGPWMPPITVEGEVWTGDALQFTGNTNAWQAIVDTGTGDPQGIPFEIYGMLSDSGETCIEINPGYEWPYEEGWSVSGNFTTANDITIDAGANFELQTIKLALVAEWPITDLNVVYFNDNGGEPGNEIGSQDSPNIVEINAIGSLATRYNVYSVEVEVDPFLFAGQESNATTYWIGFRDAQSSQDNRVFWASTRGNKVGNHTKILESGIWVDKDPWDGIYTFIGECSDVLTVGDNQVASLQVYPNPTNDIIYLDAGKPIGTVALYNMLGQEVLRTDVENNSTELNISHLPTGTYILKNNNEEYSQSYKVIKK